MNKKLLLHGVMASFLLCSCQRGVWQGTRYTPIKPKFSILKKPFIPNQMINTSRLYISIRPTIIDDNNSFYTYMGFFTDGRMFLDSYDSNESGPSRVSHDSASRIGYYTTKKDQLRIQYFGVGDGGIYVDKRAFIRPDTIITYVNIGLPFQKRFRYDTLVVSKVPIK